MEEMCKQRNGWGGYSNFIKQNVGKTHQVMLAKNITYTVQEMTRSTRYAGKSC